MIRALAPQDLPRAWEMTSAAPFHSPWTLESLAQEIAIAPSLGLYGPENRLEAFILYRELPVQLEVSWLATAPECQRSGNMKILLGALMDIARQRVEPGAEAVTEIWLEVHEDNVGAQKLYEKLNFQRTGRRPRYYGGQKAALLYSLVL